MTAVWIGADVAPRPMALRLIQGGGGRQNPVSLRLTERAMAAITVVFTLLVALAFGLVIWACVAAEEPVPSHPGEVITAVGG